jgi:RNA polymerase sigma factor (sigma-70 family)
VQPCGDHRHALRVEARHLVALDDALQRLEQIDAEQARLVELRFFGGLTIEETAEAMSISPATVKRHWTVARAWLARELAGDDQG